jgi:hypothetical protein
MYSYFLPEISYHDQHQVIVLVDQILTAKQKDHDADTATLE